LRFGELASAKSFIHFLDVFDGDQGFTGDGWRQTLKLFVFISGCSFTASAFVWRFAFCLLPLFANGFV
jgi:hypothetical protein